MRTTGSPIIIIILQETHNRFNVNGHLLIVALYFILLFFFSNTYGALKIGYLKPLDIFLSQLFSLLCVNVISYAQLSLMYGWFIIGGGHMVSMMLYQLVFAGLWGWLCNLIYPSARFLRGSCFWCTVSAR